MKTDWLSYVGDSHSGGGRRDRQYVKALAAESGIYNQDGPEILRLRRIYSCRTGSSYWREVLPEYLDE